MQIALGILGFVFAFSVQAGQCLAHSGPNTAALVELYTSEGCSSCPPADRWLSSLGARGHAPERVVPLALHVDYWDYIGWKDPYAKRDFSLRQRKLTQLQRLALVYTPQVMLQGRDFRGWGTPAFDEAVAKINARSARARLSLEIVSMKSDAVVVRVAAEILDAGQRDEAALYLAAYENRLESHDHLVLEWQRPSAFSQPRLVEQRDLPLLPKAVPGNSGVVGFVQNRRTAEVLQALMLPAC
jgi:hypothetical protein